MEEKRGHSSAHSTAHRSSQDQECSKHASSEHQEEGAVAVIGRLREPGQESLRPQREEIICTPKIIHTSLVIKCLSSIWVTKLFHSNSKLSKGNNLKNSVHFLINAVRLSLVLEGG